MFGIFKKKETGKDISERIHITTQSLFSEIGAVPTLAAMHKAALAGAATESECNDLAIGAYRTLYLAAGVAHYRMIIETGDGAAADVVANSIIESSGLSNIIRMILESVPYSDSDMEAATKEVGQLFQAATMLERLVRQKNLATAQQVWRACAKGSYMELPMLYAGISH